ncbi:MAG TPA: dTMP kinase [Bacteroidota bacterium]|nr:dTMP kinase [Bacteroidota bacterium]
MFISFEGLDGSGKTTQITLLSERLTSLNIEVVVLREPGGTVISERIREILLDKKHLGMNETTEFLLFSAARAQVVNEVIRPALAASSVVIADRYVDSSTAYQGYGRGLPMESIRAINAAATQGVMPYVTFMIDLDLDELVRRKKLTGADADRMELSGRAFYDKVRRGYLEMAHAEPGRFAVIDGAQSVDAIHALIWKRVAPLLARAE